MNKKPADPIDPRLAVAEVFKRLDGIMGMTSWAKTHRTLFYGLYAKLISQPLVQTNINVKFEDGEAARAKLQDAFMRLYDARDITTIDHDPQSPVPRLETAVLDTTPDSEKMKSPKQGPFLSGPLHRTQRVLFQKRQTRHHSLC